MTETMLAAVFHEHGERDVIQLQRAPLPQPGAEEVRIKVHACALNWLDVGIRRGPQFGAVPLPLTTGVDISGVVDALGAGASGWQVGDEVTLYSLVTCGDCEFCRAGDVTICPEHQIIGEHRNGGLAEYMLAPARNLIAKPKRLSHVEVAALPVVAGTAWHMLITIARLQAGETVFIPGAGGGVASMGIQIAKHAGATVIASTSTAEKMAKARDLGADYVVNYRDPRLGRPGDRADRRPRRRCGAGSRGRADLGRLAADPGAQWPHGRLRLALGQAIRPAHPTNLSSPAEHPRR